MIIKEKDLASGKIDDFKNKLICGETLDALKKMPDNSVSLIITSPSYFLGKSYEKDHVFNEYLDEHKIILKECKRVLKDKGKFVVVLAANKVKDWHRQKEVNSWSKEKWTELFQEEKFNVKLHEVVEEKQNLYFFELNFV